MAIRPTGYYEIKNDKNTVQFSDGDDWDTNLYTKDSVREHYRSNGWPVPIFMTTEQASEPRTYRTDEPTGGNGWYTEPDDPFKARFWSDGEWAQVAYSKAQIIANYHDNDNISPVFDPQPVAVQPVVETPKRWAATNTEYGLWQYGNTASASEFFDGNAIAEEFLIPRFYQHGGTPGVFEQDDPNSLMTQADHDLIKLIISRITLEEVREKLGDSAVEFNSGPRWIRAKDNERLARWWSGKEFTGEVELIGVLQQREHDEEADGDLQTVSHAPVTAETEAGVWYSDPEDATSMIRWGGARWDRRKSVQQMIADLFAQLNESVPAQWAQPTALTLRHEELMVQLNARINGEAGWYKEPGRFDDLFMRYFGGEAWTDQTSAQVAGWFNDPWDEELIRYWNSNAWTDKTRVKAEEQRREERNAANAELAKNVGIYLGLKAAESIVWRFSKERKRQVLAASRADSSRWLRDNAAQEQAKFYRDRQKKSFF